MASPIIGIPLKPFFIASLIGTQVTLTFQCGAGATLRDLGAHTRIHLIWDARPTLPLTRAADPHRVNDPLQPASDPLHPIHHPIHYTPSSTPHPVHPIQYLHPLAGESGFDLGPEFRKKGFLLVAFMGLVQMIPLALIRHQKRLKAAAEQQAQKLN